MEIEELIRHPERMDRDTLYELRSTLALYPYFQTARLLLLQNLYLLHDASFDEELRRAAIYITDRRVIFQMIEAAHYRQKPAAPAAEPAAPLSAADQDSRTLSLIDDFLDSLPKEADDTDEATPRRPPTPADAAVDYVAYLLDIETAEEKEQAAEAPQMKGQDLIDTFINSERKIKLDENPTLVPEMDNGNADSENTDENGVYTETFARICIKQGNYSRALQIIRQLNLDYPKKNAYFADQIRFLEKLIANNNKKIK